MKRAGDQTGGREKPTRAAQDALFGYGPPTGAQRRLRLIKPDNLNVKRRAFLFALVGWLPLALLAIIQGVWSHTNDLTLFLHQVGVHARYLIAVPLLVLAEAACAPQLSAIIRHFMDSGLVGEPDRGRFDSAVASTAGLLKGTWAEIAIIILAYVAAIATALSLPASELPVWAASRGLTPILSPAGWWHTLVSLPLLLLVCMGWMWRLALWTYLLWRISRLDLRLVASHPDNCAGLAFLGQSIRAFAAVAMALAVVIAGRSAHIVLLGQALPTQHFLFNIGMMVVIAALIVAPLLIFVPHLVRIWRNGSLQYGALAEEVGRAFERKWLGVGKADKDALERPDFSATTDLYQIVANVYAMRFLPVGLKDLIMLVVAMLLPFVPVVLLAVPIDVIWEQARSLLF